MLQLAIYLSKILAVSARGKRLYRLALAPSSFFFFFFQPNPWTILSKGQALDLPRRYSAAQKEPSMCVDFDCQHKT
jgi:hypothetical protein